MRSERERLAEKQKRADDARRAFRDIGRPAGIMETPVRRHDWHDAYHPAEHDRAFQRLFHDLERHDDAGTGD